MPNLEGTCLNQSIDHLNGFFIYLVQFVLYIPYMFPICFLYIPCNPMQVSCSSENYILCSNISHT